MKKTIKAIAVVLIVSLLSVFALTACDVEFAGVYKEKAEGEAAIELRDKFFAATFLSENVEATVIDAKGKVLFVETIANGIDRFVDKDITFYNYKKEYEDRTDFYYVYEGYGVKYYTIDYSSKFYDITTLMYYAVVDIYDDNIVDPDYSFACEINGTELTFTLYHNCEAYGKFVARRRGNLVTTATYYDLHEYEDESDSMTATCTFVYGKSDLSEPDLDDYEDRTDILGIDRVTETMWNSIFTDKDLLDDNSFTVEYSAEGKGVSESGVFKVDGNKYRLTTAEANVYYERTSEEPDEHGEYDYNYIVNFEGEWVSYPANYSLDSFDRFLGTLPAPFEKAEYDNASHSYIIESFTYTPAGASEESTVYHFEVSFEYRDLMKVEYDEDDVHYTFEFNEYDQTEVILPEAKAVDPETDPTIGGDDGTYRIIDDFAALNGPEALMNALIEQGVAFSYKGNDEKVNAYAAKGDKFYSDNNDKEYYDFGAETYDYYTEEGGNWKKETIGYDDNASEYWNKDEGVLVQNENYQSILCEGMGLTSMYSDLLSMEAYKKEDVVFLGRDACKYYYHASAMSELTVTIDRSTGAILGWNTDYMILGVSAFGYGCELVSFTTGEDVTLPTV